MTGHAPITILLATNHTIFRDGLHLLLKRQPGLNVVGEAGNLQTTLRLAGELTPRVVLLDLAVRVSFALAALRGISSLQGIRSIVLVEGRPRSQMEQAFLMGAAGIVSKELSARVLIQGIREVAEGRYWVDEQTFGTAEAAIQRIAEPGKRVSVPNAFGLTPIELSIISAIALGRSHREIEAALSIKQNTLKRHLASVFDKTGVSNHIELVLFAVHNGMASTEE